MTNFDRLKAMSLEELTEFLNVNGMYDNSPWMDWWDKHYCYCCKPVIIPHLEAKETLGIDSFDDCVEAAYCEVYDKCKYFLDLEELPTSKDIIKLWLEATDDT